MTSFLRDGGGGIPAQRNGTPGADTGTPSTDPIPLPVKRN